MSWIKVNGKWAEKSKVKSAIQNEKNKLEKNRNKILKEIKNTNTNTNVPKLRKTINKFEKIQNEMKDLQLNKKKVACIIKGKGITTTTRSKCKNLGKIMKFI